MKESTDRFMKERGTRSEQSIFIKAKLIQLRTKLQVNSLTNER